MNEEMKALLMMIGQEIKELDDKLKAIDDLLGGPHAAQFSEVVLDAMVADVLKYNGMIKDLTKFVAGIMVDYVYDKLWSKVEERPVISELIKRMKSDG